jgi:hypothetical protein
MLQRVAEIPQYFQRSPKNIGESMQHDCNKKQPLLPPEIEVENLVKMYPRARRKTRADSWDTRALLWVAVLYLGGDQVLAARLDRCLGDNRIRRCRISRQQHIDELARIHAAKPSNDIPSLHQLSP